MFVIVPFIEGIVKYTGTVDRQGSRNSYGTSSILACSLEKKRGECLGHERRGCHKLREEGQ